jgi:hypothetical protein
VIFFHMSSAVLASLAGSPFNHLRRCVAQESFLEEEQPPVLHEEAFGIDRTFVAFEHA